jgi:hypothetical protein
MRTPLTSVRTFGVLLSTAEHGKAPRDRPLLACTFQVRRLGLVVSITLEVASMTLVVGWNGPCTALRSL